MTKFLQGFILMCNAFRVDFRDYILELPIDPNGIKYDIPTYKLKEYLEEPTMRIIRQYEEYGDDVNDDAYGPQDEYADY